MLGRKLLLGHGWSEAFARFTVTHGRKLGANDPLEDLLVAIADNVWKGTRNEALERTLIGHIATLPGKEPWQVWLPWTMCCPTWQSPLRSACDGTQANPYKHGQERFDAPDDPNRRKHASLSRNGVSRP
jgi:hypothetical protein